MMRISYDERTSWSISASVPPPSITGDTSADSQPLFPNLAQPLIGQPRPSSLTSLNDCKERHKTTGAISNFLKDNNMNELIKLNNMELDGSEQQTVIARELHAGLGVKSEFRNWIKNRINDFGFVENQDFVIDGKNLPSGQTSKEYHITINMAKELCMVERSEVGKKYRLYFIQCEKIAKQKEQAPAFPKTLPEALRLAADIEEKRQALENKVKEDKPKVDFYNDCVNGSELWSGRAVASILHVQEKFFFNWCFNNGWTQRLNGRWASKLWARRKGYCFDKIEDGKNKYTGREYSGRQLMFTLNGIKRIHGDMQNQNIIVAKQLYPNLSLL